ncbi:MAG: TetR/AcrR family transcriptional regulator [Hyphomonadaceae bacterium]|nr:TetR/AcrR family transcriptional regulator [Hyphomonadaceae bacterium]
MAKVSSARENLIEAAVQLFGERGYEGVGVAELLARAGAPRGSLYFHFPGGKEQIGAEAVGRVGAEVGARLRALHNSGVDIDTFIDQVFKATAKESKERGFVASCPMAAVASGFGCNDVHLREAVRKAFSAWESEIAAAMEARGMTNKNAESFASALLASMEGAFIVSKAQGSVAPHINAARAMKALAASLRAN